MIKMSRAGRKRLIYKIMSNPKENKKNPRWPVGRVSRALGMKSSTDLKKMLFEMVETYDEIWVEECEEGTFFHFEPYKQTSFLDRAIFINGVMVIVSAEVKQEIYK